MPAYRLLPSALAAAIVLTACASKTAPDKAAPDQTASAPAPKAPEKAPALPLEVKLPPAGTQLKFFSLMYAAREGSAGEVLLNGVSLVTFTESGTSGSTNEASSWLFPGENTVELVATKLAPPAEFDSRPPFEVTLHGLAEAGFPEDENRLWRLEATEQAGFPGRRRYSFTLPPAAAPSSLLMEKAEVLSNLAAEDEKALTALTRTILAAVQKGDPATLRETWGFKMAEQARLLGRDPQEMLATLDRVAKPLSQVFAKAQVPERLEFTLVAGNRVVQVTQPGGKPAIVVADGEDTSDVPVFAARIDGRWTLVR